jgi:hypothetical protein
VRALAAFCSDGSAKFPVLPKEFDLSCDSSVCEMQIFLLRQGMWMGMGDGPSKKKHYNDVI